MGFDVSTSPQAPDRYTLTDAEVPENNEAPMQFLNIDPHILINSVACRTYAALGVAAFTLGGSFVACALLYLF